jgi:hypothetical protein
MDLTVVAYATLGLSLFVSAIKVGDWVLHADPRTIINAGRWALVSFVVLALAALVWLVASGRWAGAMMLAAFLLPVLVQAAPRWRVLFAPFNVGFFRASGLGGVPGGPSPGRELPDPELVQQSLAVLKAYLAHTRPQIESKATDTDFATAPTNGSGLRMRMSKHEALDVLGLNEDASAQDIMEAHRRLEQRLSPQFGGTRYLNRTIDEARDVLLGEQTGFT